MAVQLRTCVLVFALLTALTGGVYPAVVTGLAQLIFPAGANGSVLMAGEKAVGSSLIGQSFDDPRYFWGRPTALQPAYGGGASGGSNLAPSNPALAAAVRQRAQALRDADPGNTQAIPMDLVTASASGLDAHISPAAAEYQVRRVARARNLDEQALRLLVARYCQAPQFGFLGAPRVNVVLLNLALDGLQ